VVLKKFSEIWPFVCFIEAIFPRDTGCPNWDNCNIVKILNFLVHWNVGFYHFEHVSWISKYFKRDFEVILTCFIMYQKWGKFFENVEKFFDLVLIEEQMLQQKKRCLHVQCTACQRFFSTRFGSQCEPYPKKYTTFSKIYHVFLIFYASSIKMSIFSWVINALHLLYRYIAWK